MVRLASDAHLVELVRQGWPSAFEAVYARYHRAILSFCRHVLSDHDEAEDVVQHTFLAAYNDLVASEKPIQLRPWLFTIARNRCYSVLRARREQPQAEFDEAATEGLATQVQRRQDLRDLVLDLHGLPDDQRSALVLAELDSLSHEEIGEVLGVPSKKVKALVFQARESLVASRTARDTACSDIREQLANGRGAALRRANLRRHLRDCQGCRDFRRQVERQRSRFALLLPVAPTLALKDCVLAATVGAGAATGIATGGLAASSLLKSGLVKGIVGVVIAGAGAGTLVATHSLSPTGSGVTQLTQHPSFAPQGAERAAVAMSASQSGQINRAGAASLPGATALAHGPWSATLRGAAPYALSRHPATALGLHGHRSGASAGTRQMKHSGGGARHGFGGAATHGHAAAAASAGSSAAGSTAYGSGTQSATGGSRGSSAAAAGSSGAGGSGGHVYGGSSSSTGAGTTRGAGASSSSGGGASGAPRGGSGNSSSSGSGSSGSGSGGGSGSSGASSGASGAGSGSSSSGVGGSSASSGGGARGGSGGGSSAPAIIRSAPAPPPAPASPPATAPSTPSPGSSAGAPGGARGAGAASSGGSPSTAAAGAGGSGTSGGTR